MQALSKLYIRIRLFEVCAYYEIGRKPRKTELSLFSAVAEYAVCCKADRICISVENSRDSVIFHIFE
jgi:hypothetical protein